LTPAEAQIRAQSELHAGENLLEWRGGRAACCDHGHSRDDPAWDSLLGICDDLHVSGQQRDAENHPARTLATTLDARDRMAISNVWHDQPDKADMDLLEGCASQKMVAWQISAKELAGLLVKEEC
jgi:hypothetical protein